jgi:glycosyltransferase involved in cell wall biosynthesis
MMKRIKVLLSAYACEPDRGSEPGIGWNWAKQASHLSDLWVITRTSNRAEIERHEAHGPISNVHWVYVDLPRWARWWKKGTRGFRLYYFLWQIAAYRAARRLHAAVAFDCVQHVTIGVYWMPTLMTRLPIPLIWGPVGGGEVTPKPFYRSFSLRGRLAEHIRDAVRKLAERHPAVRSTAQGAYISLAATDATAERLRQLGSRNVGVLSHTALPRREFERLSEMPIRVSPPLRFISIGRLLHWKGFALGIRAFAEVNRDTPGCDYWIVGEGPERNGLEHLTHDLGLTHAVRFLGNLPRERVLETLGGADVLIHPSFHDSGGYVCVEAMAAGRPVICMDLGGPGLLVTPESGIRIAATSPDQALRDLAGSMRSLAKDTDLRLRLAEGARCRVRDHLLWEHKRTSLEHLYRGILRASPFEAETRISPKSDDATVPSPDGERLSESYLGSS